MGDPALAGRRVLVVEDEYLVAMWISDALHDAGASVIGPASTVAKAEALVSASEAIDFALVDLNLGGEPAFPVADALGARGVPLAFLTGYDASAIPEPYRAVPRIGKPLSTDDVVRHVADALGPRAAQ